MRTKRRVTRAGSSMLWHLEGSNVYFAASQHRMSASDRIPASLWIQLALANRYVLERDSDVHLLDYVWDTGFRLSRDNPALYQQVQRRFAEWGLQHLNSN